MVQFDFPKIDLHLHLDGSLNPETVLKLAKEEGIALPAESLEALKDELTVPAHCKDLTEYLRRFELPLKVMQTQRGLNETTYELVCRLADQGLIYAEIRFAPQLHLQQGLSQQQVVEAVLAGVHRAQAEHPTIRIGIILCTMRGGDEENHRQNLETVETAHAFLNKGVVAVDLAGAEALFPTRTFAYVFDRVRQLGIPYTIHSGEVGSTESEYEALSFGAKRLGHGIATAQDPALLERVRAEGVVLECCPTSNLHTKIVPNIQSHPIRKLFDAGLAVTVNTDNMTVSDTTLDKEYALLVSGLGFTRRELIAMNIHSAKAAFMPEEERQRLIQSLENAL